MNRTTASAKIPGTKTPGAARPSASAAVEACIVLCPYVFPGIDPVLAAWAGEVLP
jgi:hypothetical protein